MGSKYRLLPWLHEVLSEYRFASALDAFSGSGSVAYLLKAMGKRVVTNDFLNFCYSIARAIIENNVTTLRPTQIERLLAPSPSARTFIQDTFSGVFFTPSDLVFLDNTWSNITRLRDGHARALAISALVRACVKRQPRGVFTVSGDPNRYDDGRRDLRLSLREHFREQVDVYNAAVFDNGKPNLALHRDIFELNPDALDVDLVYMDPPYVPRSDDNCYMKRYHFVEGLSCYWQGYRIMADTRVKKIEKKYTPFSYRRTAIGAFTGLFNVFRRQIVVLSYSSNGYPDLNTLVDLLRTSGKSVKVFQHDHRYHFGNHNSVKRAAVTEYLIVGTRR